MPPDTKSFYKRVVFDGTFYLNGYRVLRISFLPLIYRGVLVCILETISKIIAVL